MAKRPSITIMLTENEETELKVILAGKRQKITNWGREKVREEIVRNRNKARQ